MNSPELKRIKITFSRMRYFLGRCCEWSPCVEHDLFIHKNEPCVAVAWRKYNKETKDWAGEWDSNPAYCHMACYYEFLAQWTDDEVDRLLEFHTEDGIHQPKIKRHIKAL